MKTRIHEQQSKIRMVCKVLGMERSKESLGRVRGSIFMVSCGPLNSDGDWLLAGMG
jgi:hypothetical protein